MSDGTDRPRVVAVIPARGGSKGVPGKNLRRVGGRPLVSRAVAACRAARRIDEVLVSTDDDAVAAAAAAAGAQVVRRPPELAGDTASSESALLHALDARASGDPDVLLLVQCTSPFLDPADLDAGVALVADGAADTAFSVVETYEFLWRGHTDGAVGTVHGVNHDPAHRPRRQDRAPDWRETGGFYVLDAAGFRRSRHRFFGRTAVVPVAEATALEIDSPAELAVAVALAPLVDGAAVHLAEPVLVDAVVTDFDGVHTDDAALVDADGGEGVRVSRADGLGVAALRTAGVPVLILSTERHPVVSARARKLGVEVLQGVDDKAAALAAWLSGHALDPARVAYVGNDVNDLAPLALVGWPVAVADARPEVRAAARLVLSQAGGHGAVRELADRVLAARETGVGAHAPAVGPVRGPEGPAAAGRAGAAAGGVSRRPPEAAPADPRPAG